MYHSTRPWRSALLIAALTLTEDAGAQKPAHAAQPATVSLNNSLGTHSYPVTVSVPVAQNYFNQGLRWLWAFNHAESIRSFREGERIDPTCAMCAWGVALASGPNINAAMEPGALDTARAAIARAQKLAAKLPANERALIAAMAARYASPDPTDRVKLDSAYATEMRAVVAANPNDDEARTLLADALMNLSPWNYWNADRSPRPDTPRLMSELETVIQRNSNHPGACHLFIHAVEAVDPARGVPCAERLAELMPGAGHLVHMPGHIYIRVGRYADALRVNEHAVHADETFYEGANIPKRGFYSSSYYPHNYHFLSFAASMMGASQVAIENALLGARAVDPEIAKANPWIEAITPIGYLTLVTFGRWNEILAMPLPNNALRFTTGMAYYARGVAFSAKGRWAEARAALDSVSAIADAFGPGENKIALQIAEHGLAGEIALRREAATEAVREFRAAVALEDRLAYAEPPTWYYPMRHSLGKALLAAGRYRDAERVYREDLERFPENGWSLYGLMRSLTLQKKRAQADAVKRRFVVAWAGADVKLTSSRF